METKRKPLEMARTFTVDLVMKAIKSCRNSKAFGPDKLSIFIMKHLGPRVIEYITTVFNLLVTTFQIPAIWKSSLIIPAPDQHGFRREHLTTSALLQLAVDLSEAFVITTCYQRSTDLSSSGLSAMALLISEW